MVHLLLQGGLGNQLFIWSYAHHLRIVQNRDDVKIFHESGGFNKRYRTFFDIKFLDNPCKHGLSIHKSFLYPLAGKVQDRIGVSELSSIFKSKSQPINFQQTYTYLSNLNKREFLLRGFYQFYNLVKPVLGEVTEDIEIYLDADKTLARAISKINGKSANNFQIVHIRLGDYLYNSENFGVLKLQYFLDNLDYSYRTFLATDDFSKIDFLKSVFPNVEILDPRIFTTWETFALMTNSSRLLISNSTFSWWAGTLAAKKGANVIAPSVWNRSDPSVFENLKNNSFNFVEASFESCSSPYRIEN